jgi:hypothetical protein
MAKAKQPTPQPELSTPQVIETPVEKPQPPIIKKPSDYLAEYEQRVTTQFFSGDKELASTAMLNQLRKVWQV